MKCPRCDKPINDGESYCPHCGYKLEKKKSRTWIMIGGVVLAGVVLGSVVAQTGYHAFEKQVSETQGELTADSKDALPDQKTIEANKKKNVHSIFVMKLALTVSTKPLSEPVRVS